ncbi:MAG TPA: DUF1501 domain-containing protein [Terriglobales bacterium]|nr:DUF1501 domain-containing protein [Terriglobales bacterium]
MAFSRRDFLKRTCCTAAAGFAAASFNRFGLVNALAQSAQDYKALVCVFLFGGNDSNNMVVPLSSSSYSSYQQIRSVLALPQGSLLPIAPPSAGSFGFHPKFPEMQSLFNQKHLAVLTNVGTLVRPTTRAQFQQRQVNLPQNLFSHEDQQAQMQTAALDGNGQTGWAGRTADKIQSIYGGTFPVIISLAGTNIFCEGLTARSIESSGDPTKLLSGFGSSAESQGRMSTLQSLLTFDTGVSLIQQASSITGNALQDSNALATALAAAPALATVFPANNGLANQLKQVAQIISARSALGLQRQIFFVSIGGFDTHSDQLNAHNNLYTQLSQAMNAFYQATVEIGVASQVTSFTLSDFSRTYAPDSTSGTDHAWGGHHLIMGGAVKGGDFYGTFPTLALAGPDDATNEGRWIPTTSLDQYAGTLANWFGVATADLPTIFPNLPNFSTPVLNFVG